MLSKYEEEQSPVWFSVAAAGVFISGNGFVSKVTDRSVRLDFTEGKNGLLILWEMFDVATVEYFEPRDVPREWLSAFMVEDKAEPLLEAFWRFGSSREGGATACLLLGVLAR